MQTGDSRQLYAVEFRFFFSFFSPIFIDIEVYRLCVLQYGTACRGCEFSLPKTKVCNFVYCGKWVFWLPQPCFWHHQRSTHSNYSIFTKYFSIRFSLKLFFFSLFLCYIVALNFLNRFVLAIVLGEWCAPFICENAQRSNFREIARMCRRNSDSILCFSISCWNEMKIFHSGSCVFVFSLLHIAIGPLFAYSLFILIWSSSVNKFPRFLCLQFTLIIT